MKFRMKIFETIVHTYETEAANKDEAFENIEQVYLNDENSSLARRIDQKPDSNDYGAVEVYNE